MHRLNWTEWCFFVCLFVCLFVCFLFFFLFFLFWQNACLFSRYPFWVWIMRFLWRTSGIVYMVIFTISVVCLTQFGQESGLSEFWKITLQLALSLTLHLEAREECAVEGKANVRWHAAESNPPLVTTCRRCGICLSKQSGPAILCRPAHGICPF